MFLCLYKALIEAGRTWFFFSFIIIPRFSRVRRTSWGRDMNKNTSLGPSRGQWHQQCSNRSCIHIGWCWRSGEEKTEAAHITVFVLGKTTLNKHHNSGLGDFSSLAAVGGGFWSLPASEKRGMNVFSWFGIVNVLTVVALIILIVITWVLWADKPLTVGNVVGGD